MAVETDPPASKFETSCKMTASIVELSKQSLLERCVGTSRLYHFVQGTIRYKMMQNGSSLTSPSCFYHKKL